MSKYSIRKEIRIYAAREKVFDALTSSTEIVKYYPLTAVISEWKPGSEVLYKGEVDGVSFTDFGTIISIKRPKEYSYSYWSDNHGSERIPENHQVISYQLVDDDGATTLRLSHDNIQTKEQFELMNANVWDYLLNSLKSYVES